MAGDGNPDALEKVLGVALAPLKDSRLPSRTNDVEPLLGKDVHYPIGEVALGPDEGRVDPLPFGEGDEIGDLLDGASLLR